MKTEKSVIFLTILTICLLTLCIVEKIKFPVKLYICGKGFVDCDVVAKYDDMTSCQSAEQKGGWHCDSTDKLHIVCQEKESSIVDSYCSR